MKTTDKPDRLGHALDYARTLSDKRRSKALEGAEPVSDNKRFTIRFNEDEHARLVEIVDYLRKRGFTATKTTAVRASINAVLLDQSLETACKSVSESDKRRRR